MQQSLKFTLNSAKKKKRLVSDSSVARNALLMREVRGECPDWLELTGSV